MINRTYPAVVERVIDGDTYVLNIELGFGLTKNCRVRLLGVNTPEVRGSERIMGEASKAFVESLIGGEKVLFNSSDKTDSFGRWLGTIEVDDCDLGELILESQHGTVMAMSIDEGFIQRLRHWFRQLRFGSR